MFAWNGSCRAPGKPAPARLHGFHDAFTVGERVDLHAVADREGIRCANQLLAESAPKSTSPLETIGSADSYLWAIAPHNHANKGFHHRLFLPQVVVKRKRPQALAHGRKRELRWCQLYIWRDGRCA